MAIENISYHRIIYRGVHVSAADEHFASRFWSKVAVTSDKERCWLWQASTYSNGYGRIWVDEAVRLAHKVAWRLANGRYPLKGMQILHSCDVKACVNPKHLREGTPSDNGQDASERQQLPTGERHWIAKLTENDVREIRRLYEQGDIFQRELGARFGVSNRNIQMICGRKTWKHVD